MAAKLPESREVKNHLRQLKPGKHGWIVPWGMSVAQDGSCYLNSEYTFHLTPGGTVDTLVTRDAKGHYHVDLSNSNYQYDKGEYQPGSTWFAIPVASVKG